MAVAAVAMSAATAVGQQQQPPEHMGEMTAGGNGSAKAQVQDVARKRDSEVMDSGSRMVRVPERALIELSSAPRELFHKALEHLEEEPGKVADDVRRAADLFDLEAARADGQTKDKMEKCALTLRALGTKVETRQVLSKEALEQAFARALHTLSAFEVEQARTGFAAKDEFRTGQAIRQSNYDLALALVYAKQQPSPEVSRALYDADTIGEQMLDLVTPTTAQLAARTNGEAQPAADKQEPAGTAKRGVEPLNGTNQVQQAAMIPKEVPHVIDAMAAALQTTGQQIENMK